MADGKTLEMLIKIAADQAIKTVTTLTGDLKKLTEQAVKVGGGTNVAASSLAQVQSAASRAAQSFKLFGTSSEELRRLQGQVKEAAIDLTQNGFAPESKQVKDLVDKYKQLGKQADSEEGLFGAFSKLKTEVGSLATVMAAVKVDQFVAKLGSYALEQADTMNTIKNNFGIMLNDMDAGAALAEKVNSFNVKTPFNLEQVSTATQVLYTAKVSLGDMEQYLTRFGDLAKGNAQQFGSFTNAYAKSAAKGKADMEVLNVFAEQGIPIFDALAKQMGTTSEQIADMSSKGKISFHDLDAAIKQMTNEGGGYYGTMELASQSWESAQAGLKESCNALAASIGSMLMPAMQGIVSLFTKIVNAINDSPIMKGVLLGALTAVVLFINTKALAAIGGLILKIWGSFTAQMAYNAALSVTQPWLLAGIAAVGVATAAYAKYASQQQKAATAAEQVALAAKSEAEAIDKVVASIANMDVGQQQTELTHLNMMLAAKRQEAQILENKITSLPKSIKVTDYGDMGVEIGSHIEANPEFERTQKALADAKADAKELEVKIAAANNSIATGNLNAAIAEGNALLEARDKAYAKTEAGTEEALKNQLEWAKSLRNAQVTNDDGTKSGLNSKKTEAIIAKAQQDLDDFYSKQNKSSEDATKKAVEEAAKRAALVAKVTGAGWTEKFTASSDPFESINKAREKSLEQLNKDALAAYGPLFQQDVEYQNQEFALQLYYNKQIEDAKKESILSEHEATLKAYKEEADYKLALAEHNIKSGTGNFLDNTMNYAGAYLQQQTTDTNVGKALAAGGGMEGFSGDIMMQFVKAVADALLSLENVKKSLNFVQTIVDKMFEVIGPMINDWLAPLVDCLETIGTVLGEILAPVIQTISILLLPVQITLKSLEVVLQLVGAAFEWLNNYVIVPVGNTIIDCINGVIDVLNEIPGIDIDKISKLQLVGEEAEAAAEALAEAQDEIKKKYQRQEDAVNDLLNAQISSLQSQYELGLMSRADYEKQAEAYHAEADTQIDSIEDEMNAALEAIEENTGTMSQTELDTKSGLENFFGNVGDWFSNLFSGLSNWFGNLFSGLGDWFAGAGSAVGDFFSSVADTAGNIWDGVVDVAQNIGNAVAGVAEDVWDGVTGAANAVGDWVDSWWPFDSGTTNVPSDHVSIVHKGESIIPKSFTDGIKSGDMALVGKSGTASQGNTYIITLPVTVTGSVVTEKQLVDVVYEGISDAISSGGKSALPTEAA